MATLPSVASRRAAQEHPGKARSGSRETGCNSVSATAAEHGAEPALYQAEGRPAEALAGYQGDESVATAEDIVIVNAGMRTWGVERDKLFAALNKLGWRHRLERWYAPLKPRAKPI